MTEEEPHHLSTDIIKAPISESRIKSLEKARNAKKVKKEIKELESAKYCEELKNIHVHLKNMNTMINTMVDSINGINSSGIKRSLKVEEEEQHEPPQKKSKTDKVEEIPVLPPPSDPDLKGKDNKYMYYFGQAMGAALSLGTLLYFKRNAITENPAHIKYNFL